MSTRSYICRENKDGSYSGIYCHSDGYLTHNGALLLDHYQDREKVDKLISLGDMSYLAPNINPDPSRPHSFEERQDGVCVFYGRDRGEQNCDAQIVSLEGLNNPESWIEYIYIYGKDGKWKYFESEKLNEGLKDLQEAVDKEYENMGFPRPKNTYGYFSPSEVEEYRAEYQKTLKQQEQSAEAE